MEMMQQQNGQHMPVMPPQFHVPQMMPQMTQPVQIDPYGQQMGGVRAALMGRFANGF